MNAKISSSQIRMRALAAADWFVKSQVIMHSPYWDANHGRYIYNRHVPSARTVLALNWGTARGIMVCLSAWELTHKQSYLDSALRAGSYLKSLQIMDPRVPKLFGAFAEQVPQSDTTAPRDAVEAADGLLFLYRATGDRDYLERAECWAKWFLREIKPMGWPPAYFHLYDNEHDRSLWFVECAAVMFFYHLYLATGKKEYVQKTFSYLLDPIRRKHFREDGALLTGRFIDIHSGRGKDAQVAQNDDGVGIALLCDFTVRKDEKVMNICRNYGNFLISRPMPRATFSAFPSQAIFLLELSKLCGDRRYSDFVRENLTCITSLQILKHKDPCVQGAFRGEDERADEYFPRAKQSDFITTRVTAYSALALFKLHGAIFGPYYSTHGWSRKV